jgi:tetratricopeptide (TPR) repeat protein
MERSISRCCCDGKCRIGEAWYNLADWLDDQGRSQAAIECLRKALLAAPNTVAISLRLR